MMLNGSSNWTDNQQHQILKFTKAIASHQKLHCFPRRWSPHDHDKAHYRPVSHLSCGEISSFQAQATTWFHWWVINWSFDVRKETEVEVFDSRTSLRIVLVSLCKWKNLLSTIPQSDDTKAVAIDSSYCQRCFLIMSKENQMYTGYWINKMMNKGERERVKLGAL